MGVSYKGAIAFGLVYIPVSLVAAASEHGIGFNMIHKKTGERIRYRKTCASCPEEVKPEDIAKGYNYEGDKYVILEDADFEKIKTAKDKTIHILQFCGQSEISPVFYDKSYYVVPNGGEKVYALLLRAMQESGKVGIAKAVLGTKEKLVALRADKNAMLLNTLYFADELKPAAAAPALENSPAEVELAKQLIGQMAAPFDPARFRDEYSEKLKKAIEQKIQGREIAQPAEQPPGVADLMEALRQSLQQARDRRIS